MVNVCLEYIRTFGIIKKVVKNCLNSRIMMIKSKNLFAITFLLLVFASCNSNPTDLAKEYCNCRTEIDKGTKSEEDCASLAESHTLKLQDEPEKMNAYTSNVLDCISDTEMQFKK